MRIAASALLWAVDKRLYFLYNIVMIKKRFSYWLGFQLVSMFLLVMSLHARGSDIIFRAHPQSIEINDPVVLSWDVPAGPGAGAVFITNVGRVERKGHLEVTPLNRLTTYTLLSEDATGVKHAQVTIKVKGGRGDAFPQREDFKNKRSYEIAAPSHLHLLDCFHRVLQNSMGFEVDERYNRQNKKTVFVTKTSNRNAPVNKDDEGIRSRRLAYWVEVLQNQSSTGKYTCEIRTFIQYQRRREKTWRQEKSGELHRDSAEKLCRGIRKSI
jgi:hypothetical protein